VKDQSAERANDCQRRSSVWERELHDVVKY